MNSMRLKPLSTLLCAYQFKDEASYVLQQSLRAHSCRTPHVDLKQKPPAFADGLEPRLLRFAGTDE